MEYIFILKNVFWEFGIGINLVFLFYKLQEYFQLCFIWWDVIYASNKFLTYWGICATHIQDNDTIIAIFFRCLSGGQVDVIWDFSLQHKNLRTQNSTFPLIRESEVWIMLISSTHDENTISSICSLWSDIGLSSRNVWNGLNIIVFN